MQEFMRKFTQLNGVAARVNLMHRLFDTQHFYCEELQTINDDERIGIVLKNQEIFVYKQDIKIAETYNDVYTISDDEFSIDIIVNKL